MKMGVECLPFKADQLGGTNKTCSSTSLDSARTAGGIKPSIPQIQREYSDDGLSGYIVSSLKALRHQYILSVFMVCSFFFRLQSGLSISWALEAATWLLAISTSGSKQTQVKIFLFDTYFFQSFFLLLFLFSVSCYTIGCTVNYMKILQLEKNGKKMLRLHLKRVE